VRSYWRDFGWLRFCLLSILRFCSGFRAIVVVVPEDSRARLPRLGVTSSIIRTVVCDNYRDDYLGQQVTKLYADTVTDAAYVCHVDSDCVFDRKVDVRGLIPDGRPQILVRPRPLPARRDPWLESTEEFLQLPVLHDYMCRPPFVFPRWLYSEVREHAVRVHGTDLQHYVTSRPARGFSEFNVLGAFAFHHHPEQFDWVDADAAGTRVCRWYWSWGGISATLQDELARLVS
jgi:hypothetical protein